MVEDILTDIALATACITREERRAIMYLYGKTFMVKLPEDVLHEEKLTIADRWQTTRELSFLVLLYLLLITLPLGAVRRIGNDEVEGLIIKRNSSKSIAVVYL